MTKYEITLEFETVVSVNGVSVKSETTRNTQEITGVFADVAKLCMNTKLTVSNITPYQS